MIYEHITYGYNWDDSTKTLIAHDQIKHYGMFSTFTLMLISIIGAYKKYNTLVENYDYSNIMQKFKWAESVDMYHHFFKVDRSIHIDFDPELIPGILLHPDNQHLIYKSEYSKYFTPFFKRYFSPSDIIKERIENLRTKYQINSDNSISIIYRDSDKWTDMGGGFLSVQAGVYFRTAKNLIEQEIKETGKRPEILIQTENPGVVQIFKESGLPCKFIEETKLDKDQSIYPPVVKDISLRKDWIENYVASLWLHSQSKRVVTYTGNSAFFVYLMRGNTTNFYQEKTFQMNPEDFFVINA